MTGIRVFFVGGLLSFRALFTFLSPAVYVPTLILAPLFQIFLFVFVGRAAGTESDSFYAIGNAIQYTAVPCLVATSQMITAERWGQTLGPLLVSPASRRSIFLGRALPVVVNGFFVATVALVVSSILFNLRLNAEAWIELLVVVLAGTLSCTGFGLINAAVGLRVRETAVSSNILVGLLLILSGANFPLSSLPVWLGTIGHALPLSHAVTAARAIADGHSLRDELHGLIAELLIGVTYICAGFALINVFERQSRRTGSLERF